MLRRAAQKALAKDLKQKEKGKLNLSEELYEEYNKIKQVGEQARPC
jgi:hypothetical protein